MQTIVDLLRERANSQPDFEAYRFLRDGEGSPDTRTWADLDRRARAIGASLRGMGAAGTNVLMLYPPGLDFVDGYFGCLYAGAVPVPAYPPEPARLPRTLPRVQAIVADAGARFALSTKPLLALAEMVFAYAPDLRALSWLATDTLDAAAAESWARPAIDETSLAMLQYTSGSTGTPKGVMLSHANMLANAASVVSAFEVTPEDRWFSWLPVFHDMGFMQGVLQPLYSGCPVTAIAPTAFLERPYRWLAGIHASRATLSGSPNFGYDLCVRKTTPEQRSGLDLSCWKLAFNGAETIRMDTIDRFVAAFAPSGLRRAAMFPCYGLAEATLIVSGNGRDAEPVARTFDKAALEAGLVRESDVGQLLVASGSAVAGQTVAIVDLETGSRAAEDRVGEIWVSGASVGRGYWNRAEDSAEIFGVALPGDLEHRYARTGDLGFILDQQLYVCGRVKDLIIVRGANHYPQDIELSVERAHAAIRPGCVAAFAITAGHDEQLVIIAEVDRRHDRERRRPERAQSDRRTGEPSRREPNEAAPRSEPDALDVDRLFWDVRDAITAHHELDPHAIVLVRAGSIHKTSSGKLQRRACQKAFVAGELEVLADWRSDGSKRISDVASTVKPKPQPPPPEAPKPHAPAKLAIDLVALRNASVLVVAKTGEAIVQALSGHHFTAIAGTAATADSTFAAIVSDDLALLTELAGTRRELARVLISTFDDPEGVRDALTSGRITSVLAATAGPQQLVAVVSEAIDAWAAHQTDLAIAAIEGWFATWLANRTDVNAKAIDLDAPVSGYGLDSLMIVEVQTALSEWLGTEVPATLMRGRSSIRSIARRLTSADASTRTRGPRAQDDVGVAIVGMGCVVPGARGVDELWKLIATNRDAISQMPEDRLHDTGRMRWGGMIENITNFDATFFGMAPRDAAHIDPQHRILFETTWQALEQAGISPSELAGSDAGVFVGISGSDFLRAQPEISITDRTSAAAQRLSYFFNLKGPSFAVDSGDASSLAALHLAMASLQRGECKVAIVAGVNLVLTMDYQTAYAKARLLAEDGRCKPLDPRGDGTVLSDGCGVVILKRLPDARTSSNRVHAHVLSSALRQNGRGHGLTAPNEAAQERVLREAIQAANVRPADVDYVELNARGIVAVDMIELRAVGNVLGLDRAADQPYAVGAMKANIGETRAAAGVLGVIKAVLVLQHDELPSVLHLRELDPDIARDKHLASPMKTSAWSTNRKRRIACINSFGLLGTNGVVVLGRDVPTDVARETVEPPAHVLCLSARSEDALRAVVRQYAAVLGSTTQAELGDICYTANLGRATFSQRTAVTAATPAKMLDQLAAIERGDVQSSRALGRGAARIAFLFTGQGFTRAGTAAQLYAIDARFRAVIQRCDRVVTQVLGRSLISGLYEGGEWDALLEQPATVAVELALSDVWQSWGVYPDIVIGHDIGEYAAAAVAGAMSLEHAVRLASERAKATERATAALHTLEIDSELDGFVNVAETLALKSPTIQLVSNVTGTRHVGALDAAYWRRHTCEPVQFQRGLKELVRGGTDVFLELGPQPVLTTSTEPLGSGPGVWLTSLDPATTSDYERMLISLACLYERGISPNWSGFYAGQDRCPVSLPSYPFERRRCWPDD